MKQTIKAIKWRYRLIYSLRIQYNKLQNKIAPCVAVADMYKGEDGGGGHNPKENGICIHADEKRNSPPMPSPSREERVLPSMLSLSQ